jgi:hypothetical protein
MRVLRRTFETGGLSSGLSSGQSTGLTLGHGGDGIWWHERLSVVGSGCSSEIVPGLRPEAFLGTRPESETDDSPDAAAIFPAMVPAGLRTESIPESPAVSGAMAGPLTCPDGSAVPDALSDAVRQSG